jgi:hypothetical protein
MIERFTLSNSHLNHDINHTDKKNITIIQIIVKQTFKNLFPAFEFFLFVIGFFCDERLEDVNAVLLDIIINLETTKIL